jgi:putative transposase
MPTKTFPLAHSANQGKIDVLEKIADCYNQHVLEYEIQIWDEYTTTGRMSNFTDTKSTPSQLAQVYLKDAHAQALNALKVWKGKSTYLGRKIIRDLNVTDQDTLKGLYTINKYGLWPRPESYAKSNQEARELTGLVWEELQRINPVPTLGIKSTLQLWTAVTLNPSKSDSFDYWLQLPSLTHRRPVNIPLKSNNYFEEAPGKTSKHFTLQLEDGELKVTSLKTSEASTAPIGDREVALDWGLLSLFASSEGDQYGKSIYEWLKNRDSELQSLQGQLQRLGIPLKSNKRYNKLNRRIREYVKNEVGRILKALVRSGVGTLIVEELDFRGGGLSKRMNRLVSRAGRGAVSASLLNLEEQGVTIIRVNPAYSSQECSNCGYISRANRNSKQFTCCFCGKKLDADVNAARVLKARRSSQSEWLFFSKEKIKALLDERFTSRWGLSFAQVGFRGNACVPHAPPVELRATVKCKPARVVSLAAIDATQSV